uniref:Epidermal patterning factor-like protein n=2 Tax=Nicotiana TaxID=4085 RepID=A0A1S4DJ41_TOBAC|nr:PREDICTED: EPIDERMAL PATTERNING FACTOR-like protein 8 [Nicotiana sylvestris]XP_016513304.1 PREDICTED: EPIDERMAL PATTERNING FACTOR-like protein 8 [Nicotiana tabacum]
MASTINISYSKGIKFAVIVMLIYSLTFLPSISGRSEERKQMRMIMLGSSPPKCVNRCKGCRPCMAVLVIPPHTSTSGKVSKSLKTLYTREDEGYYLLSWKCKCGTKYFQP